MKFTKTDLTFITYKLPKDILALLRANENLFLAGGFIRSTIAGTKVSDIDLFGSSIEQLGFIADGLAQSRAGIRHNSHNAITILAPPRMPVQFITRWLFTDPIALINSFDFTACQAVVWYDRMRGVYDSECSDAFYPDLAARRLVYTFPKRDEEVGGSMMRVFKFIRQGWNIQATSVAGVCARLLQAVDQRAIDAAVKHEANVHETLKQTEERVVAMVITGLLRQVDPLTVIDKVDLMEEE
jgi:hypothetical protein